MQLGITILPFHHLSKHIWNAANDHWNQGVPPQWVQNDNKPSIFKTVASQGSKLHLQTLVVQPMPTNPSIQELSSGTSGTASSSSGGGQKLQVRRLTFVPRWAVLPHIFPVDDDAVLGCAINVAVDGVRAVNKMNLEKYDLVLMDIVMLKMDGMHDVLLKLFMKDGLSDMLEKHLRHLKVIQEMSRVLRMPCDALIPTSTTSSATPSTASLSSLATMVTYSGTDSDEIGPPSQLVNAEGIDGDGSGMGLTEEWCQAILKDLISGENLNKVGVPEGFGFDMMGAESIGMGVNVNVKGMSGGMSNDMGMGKKRGLEEELDRIREVKRDQFEGPPCLHQCPCPLLMAMSFSLHLLLIVVVATSTVNFTFPYTPVIQFYA
ncbi:hypothetical protein EDC04DRAFT_2610534 [Pisolithus marmoratus]|nr:hypothetical protein EDC04DRAFT_2610534 [Pisolithus marmoratus]